jgi:hypothetical protein
LACCFKRLLGSTLGGTSVQAIYGERKCYTKDAKAKKADAHIDLFEIIA